MGDLLGMVSDVRAARRAFAHAIELAQADVVPVSLKSLERDEEKHVPAKRDGIRFSVRWRDQTKNLEQARRLRASTSNDPGLSQSETAPS
jgi:hypothetical protein